MREVYIPASETFVFEDSSGVLGFYSLLDNQLAALFVDPAHQGKGFGKQLLDHAKCLRKALSLAVYKKNTPVSASTRRRVLSGSKSKLTSKQATPNI